MQFKFPVVFSKKRKELNVTQEQIANFIGVTKAAVSKWEKGQSYPDISILPRLATYLNISIDDLLGYDAQLTKETQAKLYQDLAVKFSTQPFDEVVAEIEELLKQYYSCFPFLLLMAQLYVNYSTLASNKEAIFNRVKELCQRVIEQCTDHKLVAEANIYLANIALINQKPDEVIEILGPNVEIDYGTDLIRANAWLMKNDTLKANEIMQVKMYQSLLSVIHVSSESLQFQLDTPKVFDETVLRIKSLINTFNIEHLNINSALIFYLKAATYYVLQNRLDESVLLIEDYCRACENIQYPIELKGDEYFHLLTKWINQTITLGTQAPRDEQSIKKDLVNSILANPAFHLLNDRKDYQECILRLQKLI